MCGTGLIIDCHGHLIGDVAQRAYHIGEDVCSGDNILISREVLTRIQGRPPFHLTTFRESPVKGEDWSVLSLRPLFEH